jgi:hypothetical protein
MSCQDILTHTCAARKEIRSLQRLCDYTCPVSFSSQPATGTCLPLWQAVQLDTRLPEAQDVACLTGRQKSPRTAGTCYTMSIEFVQS